MALIRRLEQAYQMSGSSAECALPAQSLQFGYSNSADHQ
jgi:hypothetical protein